MLKKILIGYLWWCLILAIIIAAYAWHLKSKREAAEVTFPTY